MSSYAEPSNLNRKHSSKNFDNDEYIYIPSENERTKEEYEEQEGLKCELDDDETSLFENIEKVIEDNEDFVEISNKNSKNKNKVDISKPLNFQNRNYIKEIKQTTYKSMLKYWKTSETVTMIAYEEDAIKENHENNELFLSLISRSISKIYFDTETIEGNEDNDEVYKKRKLFLDDIYAKSNELSKNKNELNNYLSLEEKGKDTDPFD
ncbi:15162_t:CDS:2 [Funneliformis caledonium]|uniref:15162_t:CDS:1 n=1 Tax=Funneliformis caledonium TaxID=1117310 RepID=A0A9N9C5L5_9GLOM|nr:15162_t:CDS:2 [Funneliformis caledonium]